MAEEVKPAPAPAPAPTPAEVQAAAERLAAEKLKQQQAAAQAALDKEFLEAARKGNVGELKSLLQKGASLAANNDGNTALFFAAQHGRMDAVVFLLQKGIPLDVKNRIGSTPLMGAAGGGHKEVARLLYDLGSDPYARNLTGSSAASYARGAGYTDVAETLSRPRNVDDVSFTRSVGDLTIQEIFNFNSADRLTVVRREQNGPVEAVQRESFKDLTDKTQLRKAFDAYVKKGGKRPESDFFEAPPAPPAPVEPPKKKRWLTWKRG